MTFQKFKLTVFKLARRYNISDFMPHVNVLQAMWEKEYSPDDIIAQMLGKKGADNAKRD